MHDAQAQGRAIGTDRFHAMLSHALDLLTLRITRPKLPSHWLWLYEVLPERTYDPDPRRRDPTHPVAAFRQDVSKTSRAYGGLMRTPQRLFITGPQGTQTHLVGLTEQCFATEAGELGPWVPVYRILTMTRALVGTRLPPPGTDRATAARIATACGLVALLKRDPFNLAALAWVCRQWGSGDTLGLPRGRARWTSWCARHRMAGFRRMVRARSMIAAPESSPEAAVGRLAGELADELDTELKPLSEDLIPFIGQARPCVRAVAEGRMAWDEIPQPLRSCTVPGLPRQGAAWVGAYLQALACGEFCLEPGETIEHGFRVYLRPRLESLPREHVRLSPGLGRNLAQIPALAHGE